MFYRHPKKRAAVFCGLETLESRQLMSASPPSRATSFLDSDVARPRHHREHAAQPSQATSFIYTETENSNPGQNAVIAFRRNADGQVTEIGSFKTGGTGFATPAGARTPAGTRRF